MSKKLPIIASIAGVVLLFMVILAGQKGINPLGSADFIITRSGITNSSTDASTESENASSSKIMSANSGGTYRRIQNIGDYEVYIAFPDNGKSTTTYWQTGIRLATSGESGEDFTYYEMPTPGGFFWGGEIWATATTSSSTLILMEGR